MRGPTPVLAAALLAALAGCVVRGPAALAPAVSLSAETAALAAAGPAAARLDFGLEAAVNESDSLLHVAPLPGVRVRAAAPGGPAAAAGIEAGDVVLAVDGTAVDHPDALLALAEAAAGAPPRPMAFTVRRGTVAFEAAVTGRLLAPAPPPRELYRVDPLLTRAGYRTEAGGVRVAALYPQSPLPAAGIGVGDLIVALDGAPARSAQGLIDRLHRERGPGARVELRLAGEAAPRAARLWDPGRRVSRVALGPLLRYESSLDPDEERLTVLDLWLFSLYSYRRAGEERSWSLLGGLFGFASDRGELAERP